MLTLAVSATPHIFSRRNREAVRKVCGSTDAHQPPSAPGRNETGPPAEADDPESQSQCYCCLARARMRTMIHAMIAATPAQKIPTTQGRKVGVMPAVDSASVPAPS